MDHGLEKIVGAALAEDTINISDVIEVIETDPDFVDKKEQKEQPKPLKMFGGGAQIPVMQPPSMQPAAFAPYVVIREQPASKALRFRYECEGRSAGSIPGVTSTPENKTYPTIQVVGFQGRAMVVVSCVTKDEPYRPHPHNLVGREGCKKGVCTLEIPQDTMTVQFSNLGIQCVKKKDIEEHLRQREEIRVDPFRTGFSHRNQPTTIDLNAVRLCFQVFLEQTNIDKEGNPVKKFTKQLDPIVSDPIFDKKAMSDLTITHLCNCTTSVAGNKDDVIILLCEKVAKEDIQVRFYETHNKQANGQVIWEGFGEFPPSHVHKQTAIKLRTPAYRNQDVTEPVKVFIQLRRPSDGATSEPRPFTFRPLDKARVMKDGRKRARPNDTHKTYSDINEIEPGLLNIPQPCDYYQNPFIGNNTPPQIKVERGSSPYFHLGGGGISPNPMAGNQLGHTSPNPDRSYRSPQHMPGTTPSPGPEILLPSFPELRTNITNFGDVNGAGTSTAYSTWNITPGPMPNVPQMVPTDAIGLEQNFLNREDSELRVLTLNSGDLNLDANNLSANLSMHCSLSDIKMENGSQEMPMSTESLTRLEHEICTLNQL